MTGLLFGGVEQRDRAKALKSMARNLSPRETRMVMVMDEEGSGDGTFRRNEQHTSQIRQSGNECDDRLVLTWY